MIWNLLVMFTYLESDIIFYPSCWCYYVYICILFPFALSFPCSSCSFMYISSSSDHLFFPFKIRVFFDIRININVYHLWNLIAFLKIYHFSIYLISFFLFATILGMYSCQNPFLSVRIYYNCGDLFIIVKYFPSLDRINAIVK